MLGCCGKGCTEGGVSGCDTEGCGGDTDSVDTSAGVNIGSCGGVGG